jgi:hypothetical protein
MFGSLFRVAQLAIDDAFDELAARIAVVVLFAVALAFATSAASMRLTLAFGSETADLILAAFYAALGAAIAIVIFARRRSLAEETAAATTQARPEENGDAADKPSLSKSDQELLFSALSSLAPFALPKVASVASRFLPLIAVIIALIYFITHAPASASPAQSGEGSGQSSD